MKTIPAGRLTDYIVASASAFPAIHSYEIDGVDYIDGGYADEIPVGMAMEKGATHVIAVNLKGMGLVKYDSIKKAPNLVYIEPKWDLGPAFHELVDGSLVEREIHFVERNVLAVHGV